MTDLTARDRLELLASIFEKLAGEADADICGRISVATEGDYHRSRRDAYNAAAKITRAEIRHFDEDHSILIKPQPPSNGRVGSIEI
ncbi:MAG: hypothetical protein AB1631_28395 [Acidobacteriota bacterium]